MKPADAVPVAALEAMLPGLDGPTDAVRAAHTGTAQLPKQIEFMLPLRWRWAGLLCACAMCRLCGDHITVRVPFSQPIPPYQPHAGLERVSAHPALSSVRLSATTADAGEDIKNSMPAPTGLTCTA